MRRLGRRGACAVLGVALGLVAAATAMVSASPVRAITEAPDSTAWWSITNQGVVPDPAVPPDVTNTDLYLAGLAGDRQVPVNAPSPFPSGIGSRGLAAAITALRFTIPAGATIDKLTLHFDGAAPAVVDVLACRTTLAFIPERDGPWNDVPPYDCSVPSVGALDSGNLVFTDIGALRSGATLSFVIVPQYADRVVLAKPDVNALSMRAPLPTFGGGSFFPSSFTAPASSFTAPLSPATSPLTAPVAPPVARPAVPAPVAPAASAPAASTPTTPTAQPASVVASPIDDARARVAASLFLAAALLAFLVLAAGDATWLGRLIGVRAARIAPVTAPRARGVGRFARPRDGHPDAL